MSGSIPDGECAYRRERARQAAGRPLYHPIYRAAVDLGLQISVHPCPDDRPTAVVHSVGGGRTQTDWLSQVGQQGMAHIASLIVHGVFEKYPDLRVVIKEHGISWLPHLMWKLDDNYDLLRFESPWVKRWPSEYIRDHIKVSTQPIEESPDDKDGLARLLGSVDGMDDMLCFSTDYPHPTGRRTRVRDATASARMAAKGVLYECLRCLRVDSTPKHITEAVAGVSGRVRRMAEVEVARVCDLEEGVAKAVRAFGREIAVVRWRGECFAVRNICPHQTVSFANGIAQEQYLPAARVGEIHVDYDDPVLRCPRHAYKFALRTGRCTMDCRLRIKTYPVSIREGRVYIRNDRY